MKRKGNVIELSLHAVGQNHDGLITHVEKLKRFLRTFDLSQEGADKLTESTKGKTFSFLDGRSKNITDDYLRALGAPYGVAPEWFRDGIDDWPDRPGPAEGERYVDVVGVVPSVLTPNVVRIDQVFEHLPAWAAHARYRLVAEDALPYLRKGDLCLINPASEPVAGSVSLIEFGGRVALYHLTRSSGILEARALSEEQPPAPSSFDVVGVVVRLRRTLAQGLSISYDCAGGLTPQMMVAI
jgi:hypothetical protein